MKSTILLPYLRAMYQMYQHMHWKSSGETFYADHLLFQRLYGDLQEELDSIAERIIGLSDDPSSINNESDSEAASKLLKKMLKDNDKDFAPQAIEAEKALMVLIRKIIEDGVTDGLEDLLQGIASLHESHLYLLQQRNRKSGGNAMFAKLFKLAYHLDLKGEYDEAKKIEKVMQSLAQRVGIAIEDIVSLADYFDQEGEITLADRFDAMAKTAARKKTKYKTWKGKDEKPPAGAEHKAPKEWFEKMKKDVKKQNPDYSSKRIDEVVGNIWDNDLSDKKRDAIYKRYGKKGNPNE